MATNRFDSYFANTKTPVPHQGFIDTFNQLQEDRKKREADQAKLDQRLVQRKAQIANDPILAGANPNGGNGVLSNPNVLAGVGNDLLKAGAATQGVVENFPQAHFADNIKNPVGKFVASIPEGIINSPRTSLQGAADIGHHISSGQPLSIHGAISDVAKMAELPLNIATAGAGGSVIGAAEQGAKQLIKEGIVQGVKFGAGFGAVGGAQQDAKNLTEQAGNVVKGAATGAVTGAGIGAAGAAVAPVVSKVISKVLSKGPTQQIEKLTANKTLQDAQLFNTADKAGMIKEEQLALPAPKPVKATGNASTFTTPATPATLPVSEEEYTARFNKLSRMYDKETKDVAKTTSPLKQSAAQEEIDQRYADQINQLNNEFVGGKPNPDYQPSSTTPSGFTLVDPKTPNPQLKAVQKRVNQIDTTINDISKNGIGNRSVEDVRGLMSERKGLQDQLDGKAPIPSTRPDPEPPSQAVTTAPADTQTYIKDQVARQEAARKTSSPGVIQKARAAIDDFRTKFADSTTPIEDALSQVKQSVDVAPTSDVHLQIDRVLRSGDLASKFAKDNGIEDVIKQAPNLDELNQYLLAQHGADLAKNGIETGRNTAADAKLVADLKDTYGPIADQVTAYSKALLDKVTQYGLISDRTAALLKEKYPSYVPFNRIMDEVDAVAHPNGGGLASVSTQNVVKRITGSTRQVEDPITSLLVKTDDAFRQGERNQAARMIASYKDAPGNPFQLRELGKDEAIGTKPTISFLDNGVKRTFETTREIADAAKGMNAQQFGLWGKIFSYPTRVLRLGATGLSLPFTGANLVKDQVSAFINSDQALKTSVVNPGNFLKALFNAVGNGPEYENLVRNAGGGTSYDISREGAKLSVEKIRASRNLKSNIAYHVTHPADMLRAVEDIVGKSENLTRIQQFTGTRDALIKQGKSLEEANMLAAEAARTNTTNFARSGTWGRVINSTNPFFNAGIQGSRTLIRSLKERPVATSAKIVLTAFAPTAIVTAWNLSDPNRKAAYDDIKDYEKQGNLIILPPNPVKDPKTGKWNAIKIPMSQEIAQLTEVVRNGIEAAYNDKNFNTTALLTNLLGTGTSLNVNSPREFANQAIPQGIKPFIENVTNQNLFTGNQIVPDNQMYLPGNEQVKPTTSGALSALANTGIGKMFNLSPEKLDNFIGTAAGGVGRQLLNVADRGVAATNGGTTPISGQDPLTGIGGRFSGASGGGNIDDFYSVYKPASNQKVKMSDKINTLISKGQPVQAQRLVRDYNASIDKQFAPLRAKYGNQFDTQIDSLKYSDSVAAIKRRETTQKKKNQ